MDWLHSLKNLQLYCQHWHNDGTTEQELINTKRGLTNMTTLDTALKSFENRMKQKQNKKKTPKISSILLGTAIY